MKTKILLLLFLFPYLIYAQEDSLAIQLKNGYKWKNAPFYARVSPFGIYTGPGKYADRIPQYVEIGKTFNLIDAGIAAGRYNLRPDSTFFLQGKINMDLGNLGIFANETTVGAGKLFDGHGSLLLELTYNVMAQVSKHWSLGITTGFYDFSNEEFGANYTFFAFQARYGLQRTDEGGIAAIARRRPKTMKAKPKKKVIKKR